MRLLMGCVLLAASPCGAQHRDAMLPVSDLAAVLASEKYCRYRYDRTQIERYIEIHPASAEPGSAKRLHEMTSGYASEFDGHSRSEKSAHCGWIRTIAEEGGFLK